jgi:hypothetical protein
LLAVIVFLDIAGALFHSGGHSARPAVSIKTSSTTAQPLAPPDAGSPSTTAGSPLTTTPVPPSSAAATGGSATPGPSSRLYAVTQAVPLRNSPSQSGATLDTVKAGAMVGIQCKASGDPVNGPFGVDSWWDKVTYGANVGFVTDEYVDTKGDEKDDTKVPRC